MSDPMMIPMQKLYELRRQRLPIMEQLYGDGQENAIEYMIADAINNLEALFTMFYISNAPDGFVSLTPERQDGPTD